MTAQEIARLRELHAAATAGEWVRTPYGVETDDEKTISEYGAKIFEYEADDDADFACAAHNALPALLDELEQARQRNSELNREWQTYTARNIHLRGQIEVYERTFATLTAERDALEQEVQALKDEIEYTFTSLRDPLVKLPVAHSEHERVVAERDALAAELAQVRAQLATGKPQPTQEENDDAAARLAAMERMYERYGMDVTKWPQHALDSHTRLQAAQNEYEAKYC